MSLAVYPFLCQQSKLLQRQVSQLQPVTAASYQVMCNRRQASASTDHTTKGSSLCQHLYVDTLYTDL